MSDKRAWRPQEHARIFRRVLTVFIFGVAVGIIDADTDDLFWRRNGRQPANAVKRMIRRSPRGILAQFHERTSRDRFAQRRKILAEPCGEIDDPGVENGAVFSRAAACREGRDAWCGHEFSKLSRLGLSYACYSL